jgi:mRNA interferase RelE/StbE
MKTYRVVLTPEAQTDLERLDAALQERLLDKIEWIGHNLEFLRHQALQGQEWSDCFKYRVGDYRIIYQIEWASQKLIVLKVGHRREVYE